MKDEALALLVSLPFVWSVLQDVALACHAWTLFGFAGQLTLTTSSGVYLLCLLLSFVSVVPMPLLDGMFPKTGRTADSCTDVAIADGDSVCTCCGFGTGTEVHATMGTSIEACFVDVHPSPESAPPSLVGRVWLSNVR